MRKRLFISLLLLLTAACSETRTPIVLLVDTEVPLGTAVPLEQIIPAPYQPVESTATHAPVIEKTPTDTALPGATQAPFSERAAIIARVSGGSDAFFLLGGIEAGSWVSAENFEVTFAAVQEYNLYSAFDFAVKQKAKKFAFDPICDDNFVTFSPLAMEQAAVGVTGNWEVLTRSVQVLPNDIEVYLEALAAWLVDQSPSQPIVVIDKVWKVDLDGDGADEVFISASRFAEESGHNVEPRDYSVILMRTVIGNDVVTVTLVSDYYNEESENEFPITYRLEFIGDLNGDGRMEVVVGLSRWEGSGVMVFEIDGAEAELVLSVMCSL